MYSKVIAIRSYSEIMAEVDNDIKAMLEAYSKSWAGETTGAAVESEEDESIVVDSGYDYEEYGEQESADEQTFSKESKSESKISYILDDELPF
jgi:hypothetical protein